MGPHDVLTSRVRVSWAVSGLTDRSANQRPPASARALDVGDHESPARTALGAVDPDLTVNQVQTMEQFVDQFFVGIRVFNSLLTGFGALALLLASLGTYGVLAYSVGQRRHEIGVRMALGAQEGEVTRMVMKQDLSMAVVGLAIGTILVIPLTMVIANLLEGLATVQPITVVAVGAILFAVTMIASVVPARRAARVDPVDALRAE